MKSREKKSSQRHTLKNLLMGVKAFADLIRMETKNENVYKYLDKIDKKIDEAANYIDREI